MKLSKLERDTEDEVVIFALQVLKDRPGLTDFRDIGDKYQTIKRFLCCHL
jgi:hypothetical protein